MMIVGASQWAWQRPAAVLGLSVVTSVIAFAVYAIDKAAARRGSRRISEKTLHMWGLLGGWPGAFVAQRVFRHKTSKVSFQIQFWFTVALNCAAVAWILSPAGAEVFQRPFESKSSPQDWAPGPAEQSDLPRITPGVIRKRTPTR